MAFGSALFSSPADKGVQPQSQSQIAPKGRIALLQTLVHPRHTVSRLRIGPERRTALPSELAMRDLPISSIFLEAPTYSSGGFYAESIDVADVNGDGILDIVVANLCVSSTNCDNGSVGVLLGNGDGTFQAAQTYSSGGSRPDFVTVADVNGDGKTDIIVSGECVTNGGCPADNSVVGILLGNGDGTFQASQTFSSGGYGASSIVVVDVNRDGKPDIVVGNDCANSASCGSGNSGVVGVLLGNGDGTFQPAQAYGSGGSGADSVALADVNGDGKLDIVVANYCATGSSCSNGSVGVLLGDGHGNFQAAVNYSSGGQDASAVLVVDVNGDGKPDVVVGNGCDSSASCGDGVSGVVGVLLGNGDGTFQAAHTYNSGGSGTDFVIAADVNIDGKPDIVVAGGSVGVLLGNGDGTFQAVRSYSSGGSGPTFIASADVNRDGKPDLVVASECASDTCSSGIASVLLGDGDGTFQAARAYSAGSSQYSYSTAVGDVNGDGKPDLIVANDCASNCDEGSVGVLLGNGDGTFRAAVSYGSGGDPAESVAVADVNGDGKPDIIVVNRCASDCSNGNFGVLLGNGDGTFQTAQTYASDGFFPYSVAVGDVNGDGKPDIVVSNCSESNGFCGIDEGWLVLFLGNGDGTFHEAAGYNSEGRDAYSIALADVNGDGKLDILVANLCQIVSDDMCSSTGGVAAVLLGNGDGTFQAAVNYTSGGQGAYSIAVGDVNGDGKPDLVISNEDASVGVLLGNGDGTFQAAFATSTLVKVDQGQIALADFDGDGHLDIALGGGSVLLLGNGDGTFQTPINLGAGGSGIAVGDFDCDGSPDLAITGMTILLNRAPRVRATTTVLTSAPNPSHFSQNVTLTATVSSQGCGIPAGTVSFFDTSTGINLGTSSLNSRVATLQISALGPSTHSITATYSGDSNFGPSTSSALSQVVLGAAAKFSSTSLNFGNLTVATTSTPQIVTLTNTGDIPLTLYSITIAGANPANFTQTNNCGLALAGRPAAQSQLSFRPRPLEREARRSHSLITLGARCRRFFSRASECCQL
jgi:hypothetical protein